MPRGGARVGSGPKPKNPLKFVSGGKAVEVTSVPPDDLPSDQAEFWKRNASRAIEAGTLTDQTAESWRLLCELDARRHKIAAQLDRDGETYLKAWVDSAGQEHQELKKHPLSSEYRGLAQRCEALLGRFGLAPFGKPVAMKPKKVLSNPWAAIVGNKA